MQNIYPSKGIIKKGMKQSTQWEKIVTNNVSGKGLVFRVYKNSYKSTIKQNKITVGHE